MIVLISGVFANIRGKPRSGSTLMDVWVHYLGQATFILQFGNGIAVLTDYDFSVASNAGYPLCTFKDIHVDIATCSHQDPDSYWSAHHPNIVHILTQQSFQGFESLKFNGIKIMPILTSEQANRDNVGFVFTYRDVTIVHPGNNLEDIAQIYELTVQRYVKRMFPHFIDLLLLPIGGSHEMFEALATFIALLRPRRVVPMQYLSPQIKEDFLGFLVQQNAMGGMQYQIQRAQAARYVLMSDVKAYSPITIISLEPESFPLSTSSKE